MSNRCATTNFPRALIRPAARASPWYLPETHQAVNADTEPLPLGFDPKWLEPLDSRGYLVDMNQNTVRDTRDSVAQAWRRRLAAGKKYGVLKFNEPFTHAAYVGCVTEVATDLSEKGLLANAAAADYIRRAKQSTVGASEPGPEYLAVPLGRKVSTAANDPVGKADAVAPIR